MPEKHTLEILEQRIQALEQELIVSRADCRRAQEIAHVGNWNWESAKDRIVCSDEFYRIIGVTPENFVPSYEGYINCIHPDDIEIFNHFEKTTARNNIPYSKRYRIIRPEGDIRIIQERGEVTLDSDGNPVNSFGTIQDITDLVHAEMQFRTIVQTAMDGFCLADKKGRVIEVNDTFCRMLGYSREEMLHLDFSDIDAERTSEEISLHLREIINTGRAWFETKHRRKDGTRMDVEIHLQYSDIRNGIFIAFIRDISEKKKIINALEINENRYRDLFDRAPIMYVVTENQNGLPVIVDCNRQFLSALRYNRADVIGKPVTEFYTEVSKHQSIREDGFRRAMENKFTITERELISHEGNIITTLVRAVPEYDLKGNVTGTFIMLVDISPQKRAEEQLRESNEMLLMIFDGISDPLIMVDKTMNLIMMNRAAEGYFGKTNENCLGQKCHDVFKQYQAPCKACRVSLTIHTGRKETFERKGLMNPEKLEQVSIYPVQEQGYHIWAAIIRISDVTKAKQIEAELIQADKMISLGILVSGVAHEINNPNNFIMLNTPVLEEAWKGIVPVLEKYYRQYGDFSLSGLPYTRMRNEIPLLFSGIKNGANRIQMIVQDLKNFARQENNGMDELVDINQVIKDSIGLTGSLIKKTTRHFNIDYGKRLPMIKGNTQKLEQVMINLIQNACDSLPDMERRIFVRSSFYKKTGNIEVEVRDEGTGIPEELLPRIMDPFFTTKRASGGTGLGLAVSSRIIKAHGGTIEVESKVSKGSVFRVVIPVTAFEKPVEILVADDDPAIRKFVLDALKEFGYYFTREAGSGKDALLKIGQKIPDLLILDIQMPDMDGLEVCRLIRKRSELSGIEVIIITGFPESSSAKEIVKLGFNHILVKPFTLADLEKIIDKALEVDK